MDKVNLIIVGSGPAGLTAAIYAGRAGLNPLLITGDINMGGQLMITTEVENFPGFKSIQGPELINNMFEQVKQYNVTIIDDQVTDIEFYKDNTNYHKVTVGNKIHKTYETNSIIWASGAKAKWLNIPNEHKFVNKGISACATCDGPLPLFRNKDIYVVGGGDSACEEALFLTKFAKQVYIIHRRDTLRASKIMADRVLNNNKITMIWNTIVVDCEGDNLLNSITLQNVINGEITKVQAGGLFVAIGHDPSTKLLALEKTLELDEDGYIKVHEGVKTNIRGVFAAGDCHDKIYKQAITASAFGCMAAIQSERYLSTLN